MIDGWIVQRHALADETLGAGKSHAALVGEEFADGADAAGAEVIDVIGHAVTLTQLEKIAHRLDDVFLAEDTVVDLGVET